MDQVLKGLPFSWCYIDDVIIFIHTLEEHVQHLQQLFERLQSWGCCLHHGKCKFFYDQLPYLGHMITLGGLGIQEVKVEALKRIPIPKDVSRLRAFVELANHYRQFVHRFSLLAKPLI